MTDAAKTKLTWEEIANLQAIEDNPLTADELDRLKRWEAEGLSPEEQIARLAEEAAASRSLAVG